MKLWVTTAEEGAVAGPAPLLRSTCSFVFLVVPMATELPGDLLGWAGSCTHCWDATGALGPGEAGGMEGSQFALEIQKETVFSGR